MKVLHFNTYVGSGVPKLLLEFMSQLKQLKFALIYSQPTHRLIILMFFSFNSKFKIK